MHLVSTKAQAIEIREHRFELAEGETILSECSYKYAVEEFQELARRAHFEPEEVWTDPKDLFSVHYMVSTAPNETSA